MSNTRKNICFSGMERCKLIQLRFKDPEVCCKTYNLYIRWNFKIMKPSWRNVWFNKYHQATYAAFNSSIYGLIILIWKLIIGKRFIWFCFCYIFLSTILSKSPTLFLKELIFRYEKITLLRSECCKRFKVTVIFSSYS